MALLPIVSISMPIPSQFATLKSRNFHAPIAPSRLQHLNPHTNNTATIRSPYPCCIYALNPTQAPFWTSQVSIWNVGVAFAVGDEVEAVPAPVPVPDTLETRFISILLIAAFLGIALLTFGVIYLAVKDYQEKRERDKLLKRRKAQEKKEKRSKRAKSGPRGFGQKNRLR